MNLIQLLSLLVPLSAFLHIRAIYRGPQWQIYIFKPVSTLLILGIALLSPSSADSAYKWFIVAGLLFSLAGDIFLMLPNNRFVAGLVSFSITHILYTFAFTSLTGLIWSFGALLPYLVFGIFVINQLWPYLGRMRLPALIYLVVIVTMAWQATGRWLELRTISSSLAFIGALLFFASDSILSFYRFRNPNPRLRAIYLIAYYAAQWLIALSAVTS